VTTDQKKPILAMLSRNTRISLAVQGLQGVLDSGLPTVSVGAETVHVENVVYDSGKDTATVIIQITPNPTYLEGLAEGAIVFAHGSLNQSATFQVEYVDDSLPYVASMLQPSCSDNHCKVSEVQTKGGELIALHVGGILTRFSTGTIIFWYLNRILEY
jgi:hypothetical protein